MNQDGPSCAALCPSFFKFVMFTYGYNSLSFGRHTCAYPQISSFDLNVFQSARYDVAIVIVDDIKRLAQIEWQPWGNDVPLKL